MENKIRIAWMYPDTLYLHGERGNILALKRYSEELGMEPVVDRIDLGTGSFDPMEYDILFFGPGEISSFPDVMKDIWNYEHTLAEYIASGKVLIATGATFAMFCEKIYRYSPVKDKKGEVLSGLCMVPGEAYEREYVFGDDLWISAEYNGRSMELIGNQIQMADIEFSECDGYRRLGTVIYGRGNNGSPMQDESGTGDMGVIEGIVHNNSIFTNMLGPIFVGNPWLTVEVLRTAAAGKGYNIEAAEPEYDLELKSLELKKDFISVKGVRQSRNK